MVVVGGPGAAELAAPVGLDPLTLGRDLRCGLVLPDPSLGRVVATVAQIPDRSEVAMITPAASSELTVDGEPVAGPRELGPGAVLQAGETSLRYEPPGAGPPAAPPEAGDTITPGPRYIPPPAPVVFDPVGVLPAPPAPPRLRLAAAAAPLLMGAIMAVTVSPRFLFLVLVSPLVLVLSHVEGRWQARRRYRADLTQAEAALAERWERVSEARSEERAQRHLVTPDLARIADWATARSPELWSRTRTDPSFGLVRVGTGEVPSVVTVRPETRGDPAMRAVVDARIGRTRCLAAVPVTVDLAGGGVVALVGRRPDTDPVLAGLLLQLAVLHRPTDLALVAAPAPASDLARWVGWLPHLRSPDHPFGGRSLALTPAAATAVLRPVAAVAAAATVTGRPAAPAGPHLVVVVDADAGADHGVVARITEAVPAGVTIVWQATEERTVPRGTRVLVRCRPPSPAGGSTIVEVRPHAVTGEPAPVAAPRPFRPDRVSAPAADRLARRLAPLHDPAGTGPAGRPPDTVALLDILTPVAPVADPSGPGARRHRPPVPAAPTVDEVLARWSAAPVGRVPVPLGVGPDGPLSVDLVTDGPHLLIGGTTGSGKSELLASMVAGLVTATHPDQVNVLFIDFKGGALADQFAGVPHVAGSVSDLDALEANRALRALRAELERRMTVLKGRARDRADLLARHPDAAFPALVIVIDEFATITRRLPDFMAGMIDLAQRGRSLGIHLVLATQRPSVAVDENVLANTSIRVALRTLDEAESRRLVGVGDAAAIEADRRGRALVRLGPGRLHLIQAPLASAPALGDGGSGTAPVAVGDLTTGLVVGPCAVPTVGDLAAAAVGAAATQLDQVRAAVIAAGARAGSRGAVRPWPAPLPATIPLDAVLATADPVGAGPLPIGLADLPDEQIQRPATIDLDRHGGLVVLGTAGSGRSGVLCTVADMVLRTRPRAVLVGFDGGAGPLDRLAGVDRCVGVAPIDDLEATTRQIAALERELRHRRSEPDGDHRPVVVLVDDLDGVAAALTGSGAPPSLHRWYEALVRVMVEGHGVGVAVVVSARRRASLPTALLAAVGHRLALRQAEASGWAELGLPGSALAGVEFPPGRGFLDGVLVQVARVDAPDPTRLAPPATVPLVAEPATRVEPIPARLATAALPDLIRAEPGLVRGRVTVGVADITGDPVTVAIGADPVWVVGDHRSGRSTALATTAAALVSAGRPSWVVGPPRSPLVGSARPGVVAAAGPDDLALVIERLLAGVGPVPAAVAGVGPVLIVDDLDRLDGPAVDPRAAALISAGIPVAAATTAGRVGLGGLLTRHVRQAPTIVHLRPRSSRQVQETTGAGVVLRPTGERPPGRAIVAEPSGRITEAQLIMPTGSMSLIRSA
ncbi:MAG: FtsK/SpoIIIE domain-containing protein [Acidimicrobiales bacterium]